MSLILDIVLILILVGSFFVGVKRGFVQILAKIVIALIIIPICLLFVNPISNHIQKTAFGQNVQQNIMNFIDSDQGQQQAQQRAENNKETINDLIQQTLSQNAGQTIDGAKQEVSQSIATMVIKGAVLIVMYFGLLLLGSLLSGILVRLIDAIPFVNSINTLAGGALGVVYSLIIMWIILFAIGLLNIANPEMTNIMNNSFVVRFLQSTNPIMNILNAISKGQYNILKLGW